MIYACIDKITKEPMGVADLEVNILSEWESKYILKAVGESFRGKQASDLKYINETILLKTQQELDDDKIQDDNKEKEIKKQDILDILGLTEDNLLKIKNL